MAEDDWYRRRTWNAEDQAAFFAKLRRSRSGFHKAQYCRIQAYELQQAGEYRAALQLLEMIMAEWPDDAQQAAVFVQQAGCWEKLGDKRAALEAYRQVFLKQRAEPSHLTQAHLGFGLLVALSPFPECFDEALSVLNEFGGAASFPVEEFQSAAIRALIAHETGDDKRAAQQARIAIKAAARKHSGYAQHPTLGLVTTIDPALQERLARIMGSNTDPSLGD